MEGRGGNREEGMRCRDGEEWKREGVKGD